MSIPLYMDVHVPGPITRALVRRGVDVKTAQQDGTSELEDDRLLDRATALNRALFTRDEDLLAEAKKRQQTGRFFAGIIYAHQLRVTIGTCINDLEIIAKSGEPETCTIASSICPCDRTKRGRQERIQTPLSSAQPKRPARNDRGYAGKW